LFDDIDNLELDEIKAESDSEDGQSFNIDMILNEDDDDTGS